MVRRKDLKLKILALITALCLLIINGYFGMKYFLAGTLVIAFAILSLIDLRIAVLSVSFAYVFLPDKLGLIAFLGLGFLYILKNIFLKNEKIKTNSIYVIIFLYLIVIIIETITSVSVEGSLRDLGLHLAGIVYLFVVTNTIDNKKDFNSYITIILAAATFVSLIGLVQAKTGVAIRREWLDVEANPDVAVRVFSVFGNPNILAEYLVMFSPIGVGMFWYTKSLKKKFVFGIGIVAMLLCLVLTMSRGGWIGIAVAALVFCLIVDKKLLLLIIPIAVLAFAFLPASFTNRILSIGNKADSSNAYRLEMWSVTLDIIKDNFLIGVGFGHKPFKLVFETYIRTMNIFHSHNTYLQTLGEIGILGFSVFIGFILSIIILPYRILVKQKYKKDNYFKYIGSGLIAGIIGVFSHGMFENILYLPRIIFSFWVLVSIVICAINVYKKESPIELIKNDDHYKVYTRSQR